MVDVLKYIHEHILENLSMNEVARQFGYSKWHFCAKFREYTGRTFVEYVRHYRIQLAALEILQGRKITDVAMDHGYDTVGGFNKSFLTVYGCVPSEYKNHARACQLYYERRKMSMYPLSSRCAILREEAVRHSRQQYFCAQRNVYYTLGAAEAKKAGLPNARIISAGIAHVLEKMTPYIAPGELIAGFNFGDAGFGEGYGPRETPEGWEMMAKNGISQEDARSYFEIQAEKGPIYTWGPDYEKTLEEHQAQEDRSAIGRVIADTHTVIGYERVLELGFSGLLERVEHWEGVNGTNPMYQAMKQLCTAACTMGEKFAARARELLDSGAEGYQPEDLRRIAENCAQVPARPARTFMEAVQSLWFAHILNTWEDGINANSLGRLDQILYPYYQADLQKGILTKEEAFEIICCLWLKLYRDYDVQQSCVGGTDAEGNSQVNELSYMMLDATEQLNIIRCMSVRFSQKTEHAFLRRALEVVGHVQKGIPFFFNDDVMIPALMGKGIHRSDACGYTQIGCVETVIPGKSNPHAVTGETNLLKAMEYVLCNGGSMVYPNIAPGVPTGELSKFKTYEQFYQAILTQLEKILDITCRVVKNSLPYATFNFPRPYKSLLTDGCLETGRDFNDAGAQYDYYQIMLGGIPNLADALVVIKHFVYRDKKYTLEQLREILMQDYPDEAVRQAFINKAPKFGNDLDEVDSIAAHIMDFCCEVLEKTSQRYGICFHGQPFTFKWMIDDGQRSAASPDGRHLGDPIAYSCSPMQGRDFNGLTALLNSLAKFPTKKTPGTTSAIVEVDPKLFCDHNIDILTDILAAAGEKGLSNVQFNTVDAETLIDARKHPERYNNLAVRVCGFSQKFNLLTPELQDHIIGRTKHTCL